MTKSIALLVIYDRLLRKEPITIEALSELCDRSRRTCLRYIKDIRYFLKKYKNTNLLYDRKKKFFLLSSK